MRVDEFDYQLPEELIALHPAECRDAARMMVIDRASGQIAHRGFADLPGFLRPGDLLVLNDTKVIPARIFGRRATGGAVELLLTEPDEGDARTCRALARSSKRLRAGERIALDGGLEASVVAEEGEGFLLVHFGADPLAHLDRHGHTPLPPYIGSRRAELPEDAVRYQTVYARRPGSCAAPTAGLHFTPEVLDALRARGVGVAWVTLHVGPGTFLPVRSATVEEHRMHEERYEVPAETIALLEGVRGSGGRVVACGTTSVRALESFAQSGEARGRTDLFIHPGFRFQVVDALLTNFHLPRSTLLVLVAAFCGLERVLSAYRVAVQERYRFYSYGDCMLVL